MIDDEPQELSELSQSGGYNRVWITTENESPTYLTREDILGLGFRRSHPERKISQHMNNPNLYLEEIYSQDLSIKDFVVKTIEVFILTTHVSATKQVLYSSTKPKVEDILKAITEHATQAIN